MAYCVSCRHQLGSTDKFCAQCGTPVGGQARPGVGNGRWEYKDLTINMGNVVVQFKGLPVGDIPHVLVPIADEAVSKFLNQIAQDGWEPREATDARSLFLKGRFNCSGKVNFWGTYTWTVHSIHLSCKRWVAS